MTNTNRSARLPLARRILDGEKPLLSGDFAPQSVSKMLEQSVFFDIQVAEDLICARLEKERAESLEFAREDFGPMRPPYPHMWLEWGGRGPTVDWLEMACAISEKGTAPNGELVYTLMLFAASKGRPIHCVPEVIYLVIGADGRHVGKVTRKVWDEDGDSEPISGDLANETLRVEMALSLMNCRNVKTVDTGVVAKAGRSGAQKRRGEKPFSIRYNTIQLPGGGSEYDAKSGTYRATALHRVRGHFKTFTAERPLLGRAVGTYWWGWQLRGDPKRGIVISDYQIDGEADG
jgi:hypothetical protein